MSDHLQSPIVRFGLYLEMCIVFLSVTLGGYVLFQIFLEANETADWPSVAGKLEKARVVEDFFGNWSTDVSYGYNVNGREYTGSRIRASDGEHEFRDGAEQAIRGFREGQRIAVYYDPNDPEESVLHAGAGFQEYGFLVVPIIGLVIVVRIYLVLRRSRPPRSTTDEFDEWLDLHTASREAMPPTTPDV